MENDCCRLGGRASSQCQDAMMRSGGYSSVVRLSNDRRLLLARACFACYSGRLSSCSRRGVAAASPGSVVEVLELSGATDQNQMKGKEKEGADGGSCVQICKSQEQEWPCPWRLDGAPFRSGGAKVPESRGEICRAWPRLVPRGRWMAVAGYRKRERRSSWALVALRQQCGHQWGVLKAVPGSMQTAW